MQLTELQQLCGEAPLSAEGASEAVQAAVARLTAAAAANGKAEEQLAPSVRAEVHDWLRRQLAALSQRLGCSVSVLPPWAGQAQGPAAAAPGGEAGPSKAGKAAGGEAKPEGAKQRQQHEKSSKASHKKKGKAAAAAAAEAAATALSRAPRATPRLPSDTTDGYGPAW